MSTISKEAKAILEVVVENVKEQIQSNVITPQIKIGPLAASILRTAISELNLTISEEFEGEYPEQYVAIHVENLIKHKLLSLAEELNSIQ